MVHSVCVKHVSKPASAKIYHDIVRLKAKLRSADHLHSDSNARDSAQKSTSFRKVPISCLSRSDARNRLCVRCRGQHSERHHKRRVIPPSEENRDVPAYHIQPGVGPFAGSNIKCLEYRKSNGDSAEVSEQKDISPLKREIQEDSDSNDIPMETTSTNCGEETETSSSQHEELSQNEENSAVPLTNDANDSSTTISPTGVDYTESGKENNEMNISDMLNKVLKNIDEKLQQSPNKPQKDGVPCHFNGSWVSQAGGIVLTVHSGINGNLTVVASNTTPPSKNGILSTAWGITGYAPFAVGAPFMLTATNKNEKKIAAFVGQCKVCEGRDTVSGTWIFGRGARDCDDLQLATLEHRDVFHREFLHSLLNNTSHSNKTLPHA